MNMDMVARNGYQRAVWRDVQRPPLATSFRVDGQLPQIR